MKLYRFSPIKTQEQLLEAINHIHFACYKLCKKTYGSILPNAGYIGIFCHYDEEYDILIEISKQITDRSDAFNGKYFRLHKPIVIPAKDDIPETIYSYLYIRRVDPYRHHVGDIDFYMDNSQYSEFKESLLSGEKIKGIRAYSSDVLDLVELHDPDIDVLGYITTQKLN